MWLPTMDLILQDSSSSHQIGSFREVLHWHGHSCHGNVKIIIVTVVILKVKASEKVKCIALQQLSLEPSCEACTLYMDDTKLTD